MTAIYVARYAYATTVTTTPQCHSCCICFFCFQCFSFYSPLFSCNVNIVIEKLNEAKREPLNTQSIFRFDRVFFSALLYIRISESFIDIIYPPNMLQTLNLKRKLNQINRGVFTLNIAKLSEVNAVFRKKIEIVLCDQ